ncbi:phage portal protein [Tianweitania sediminis]|uniref:Phage portal protein n=1 Tax=Tianweitania sediminis TaxID=1502156 RepID=A0A8J7UHV2_9HYPH|nr:phage portal protein [Tianweitania sediminis]MBP0439594.1 phage portal protein [Tianweitania sediminis]
MTLMQRIKSSLSVFDRRSVKLTDGADKWLADKGNHAGKRVTAETTLNLSTAWRCIRLKSGVVGALPIQVYERKSDGGSVIMKNHWLYELVHDSPNSEQTPAEFWGGMIAARDLWGNAYAEKQMVGDRVVSLRFLRPDRMHVFRKNGERRYRYSDRDGSKEYGSREIFHLRGFTLGGDIGLSAVSYGRHTLGLALASDETAAKTFQNGLQLSGFAKPDASVKSNAEQRKELMELFAQFAGSSQTGKVMPLPGGWSFEALSMSPADAQLLESRAFNVEEICRWYDTPPILVGHAGKGQTMWGSGVEQILLGWVTLDLDPLLTGTEQAIVKQLLGPVERKRFYAEYTREALLQADSAAKAAFLSTMTQNGLMTRNEGRSKLNLSRIDGGDELTAQTNLAPLSALGQAAGGAGPAQQVRTALIDFLFGSSLETAIDQRVRQIEQSRNVIEHHED